MKNNTKIALALIVIIITGTFLYLNSAKQTPIGNNPILTSTDEIKGCYVALLAKDVYTLTILSQNGESVSGTLAFKNFEKDSSSGTFSGTYKNGILLGDYFFQSEGMNSVMQVIFKKQESDFIRGFGDMNTEGTSFTNLNTITYDSFAPFQASKENCAV